MKKILLPLILSLISFNSYAYEHVIGFSGGYSAFFPKASHYQTNKHKNTINDDDNKPLDVYRQFTHFEDKKYHDNAYNFEIEYQIRLDGGWILGVGYRNEIFSLNSKYALLDSNSFTTHNPYILGLGTFYQSKNFSLSLGGAIGSGLNKIGNSSNTEITIDMIFDVEYLLSDKFLLFTRLNTSLSGKEYKLNTKNTLIEQTEDNQFEIIENYIKISPKNFVSRLNFGIRYKI